MPDKQEQSEPLGEKQLVAYLDGELDEDTVREIEEQLATDPELRRRLDSLSGAWAMLDELERPEVKNDFTESTLEIVALGASSDAGEQHGASAGRTLRRIAAFAAGVLTAGLFGFLCVALARPDADRRLLENLEVVERLDEFRQIDDIDFLRELHESRLFSEDSPDE